MKAVYEVTTKHRNENPTGNINWASYKVIARSASEAIRRAKPKFTFKAEYATEVKLVSGID